MSQIYEGQFFQAKVFTSNRHGVIVDVSSLENETSFTGEKAENIAKQLQEGVDPDELFELLGFGLDLFY